MLAGLELAECELSCEKLRAVTRGATFMGNWDRGVRVKLVAVEAISRLRDAIAGVQ